MLNACGDSSRNTGNVATQNRGAVAMHLEWEPATQAALDAKAYAPSGNVCDDYGITRITAKIYHMGQEVASGDWPCKSETGERSGTIDNVPAGTGMRIGIVGWVGPTAMWFGENDEEDPVMVVAGQTTYVNSIVMRYNGAAGPQPEVTASAPGMNQTGVELTNTIEVVFSESVVPASIDEQSITVSVGAGSPLPAIVQYHEGPDSYKAVVTLETPLVPCTTYTVTVTEDIENRVGMELDRTQWHFTTRNARITASIEGGGTAGSINPSGTVEVACGNQSTFIVMPDESYYLSGLVVDGEQAPGAFSYTFDDVTSDHAINAVFEPNLEAPALTGFTPAAGADNVPLTSAITFSFSKPVDPDSVNEQTVLVAGNGNPVQGSIFYDDVADNYRFDTDTDLSYSTIYTVTLTNQIQDIFGNALHSVQWTFRTFTPTITSSVQGGGHAEPSGIVDVVYGQSQTITLSPDSGYYLSSLTIDGVNENAQPTYTFYDVTDHHTISAVFKPVVFVDGTRAALDTDDGGTWETAYTSIQAAVDAANEDDEIWVAAHQYDLGSQIVINKQVELYGGFAGAETHRDQRDSSNNATIIDAVNSTRCMYLNPDSGRTIIDGFTMQNGQGSNEPYFNATGLSDYWCGGAIYVDGTAPLVRQCHFLNNLVRGGSAFGGAIFNFHGSPTIENCIFENCTANGYGDITAMARGGAVYSESDGATTILGSLFFGNLASGIWTGAGGAVCNVNTVINSVFAQNEAEATAGLIAEAFGNDPSQYNGLVAGGAIYNKGINSAITNCTIIDNTVTGELLSFVYGGGVYSENGSMEIHNTILWGNTTLGQAGNNNVQLQWSDDALVFVNHSDINQAGFSGINNNIWLTPQFAAVDDYHLSSGSPCINSADPTQAPEIDIDGDARPQDTLPDIGADEFLGP